MRDDDSLNPKAWINRNLEHTLGDFATVARKSRISSVPFSPGILLEGLAEEAAFKRSGSERSIGFLVTSNTA